MKTTRVTEERAIKVLATVDAGLIGGTKGYEDPGHMCVQSAVAHAMGLAFNDSPSCVHQELRGLGIHMNDDFHWANEKARAKGLRAYAIAELGTNKKFNVGDFVKQLKAKIVEVGGKVEGDDYIDELVDELVRTYENRSNAHFPVNTRWAQKKAIADIVTILTEMRTEGSKFVCLTKLGKAQLAELQPKTRRVGR